MASETVDPIDWSHPPPYTGQSPLSSTYCTLQITRLTALSQPRTCDFRMPDQRTAGATTQGIKADIHALGTQLGPVVNPRSDLGSQITYSDIVRQSVKPNINVKVTKNMSMQTDECDSFEHLGKTFFDKLKICLVELFQSSIMKEKSNARCLSIDNVLQHQFGN